MALTESLWFGNFYCNGPPAIVNFLPKDSHTELLDFFTSEFEFPHCGPSPVLLDNGCCARSENLEESLKVQSAMYSQPTEIDPIPFPAGINNHLYCDYNQNETRILILADGECYFGNRCSVGQLSIYENWDCTGDVEYYYANSTTVVSNFNITGATIDTLWLTYTPSDKLSPIPEFSESLELPSFILAMIAQAGSIYLVYLGFSLYLERKLSLLEALLRLLYLMYTVSVIVYWTVQFPDSMSWIILEYAQHISSAIVTFLAVLETAETIMKYMEISKKSRKYYWFLTSLCSFHIITSGGAYIEILIYYEGFVFVHYWLLLRPVWKFFVYLFDIVPILYITKVIFFNRSSSKDDKKLAKKRLIKNKIFILILVGQSIGLIWFVVVEILQTYVGTVGNDRAWLALHAQILFVDITHIILNHQLSIRLRQIVAKAANHAKADPSVIVASNKILNDKIN